MYFLGTFLRCCWRRHSLCASHTHFPLLRASGSPQSSWNGSSKIFVSESSFFFFFFSDRFTVPSHLQSLLIVVLVKVKCACEGPGEAEEKQMSQEVWSGPLSIPRGWGTAGPRITLWGASVYCSLFCIPWRLCLFSRAAVTKDHRLTSNNRNLMPQRSGTTKSKIKVSTGPCSWNSQGILPCSVASSGLLASFGAPWLGDASFQSHSLLLLDLHIVFPLSLSVSVSNFFS